MLRLWVAMQENSAVRERIQIVCFENVTEAAEATVTRALDFLYNGTDHPPSPLKDSDTKDHQGKHATSHDPALTQSLMEVVKKIDDEHYGGDIAWLDSVFPC